MASGVDMKPANARDAPTGRYDDLLCLTALGVVDGDIGTSPLYAFRECFHGEHAIAASRANVLGVLSLAIGSLIVVVTVKYLIDVMRADNEGEGGILVGLFMVRRRGTASVGMLFGPIALAWFLVLALVGVVQILGHPDVLPSFLPTHAVSFFIQNGWHGVVSLGSVFRVVTGGEALDADMGHFGLEPIRQAWLTLVFPALVINYLGQGALLIEHRDLVANAFFHIAPGRVLEIGTQIGL